MIIVILSAVIFVGFAPQQVTGHLSFSLDNVDQQAASYREATQI